MKKTTYVQIGLPTILSLLCVIFLVGQPVYAGTLDNFEEEATDDEHPSQGYQPASDDDDDESLLWVILRGIFRIFFLGDDDDDDYARTDGGSHARPESGSRSPSGYFPRYNPVLRPSLRLDAGYQNAKSDVRALDFRAEGGYDFLAAQGRFTYYNEQDPADEMWLNYLHGLLRMSLGNQFVVGAGAGAIILDGNDRNSGFSLTAPVLFYPQDSLGFEFRPVWSWIRDSAIHDYDAGLVLGSKHTAFRAGYRWVYTDGESLEGPYLGLTVRF